MMEAIQFDLDDQVFSLIQVLQFLIHSFRQKQHFQSVEADCYSPDFALANQMQAYWTGQIGQVDFWHLVGYLAHYLGRLQEWKVGEARQP